MSGEHVGHSSWRCFGQFTSKMSTRLDGLGQWKQVLRGLGAFARHFRVLPLLIQIFSIIPHGLELYNYGFNDPRCHVRPQPRCKHLCWPSEWPDSWEIISIRAFWVETLFLKRFPTRKICKPNTNGYFISIPLFNIQISGWKRERMEMEMEQQQYIEIVSLGYSKCRKHAIEAISNTEWSKKGGNFEMRRKNPMTASANTQTATTDAQYVPIFPVEFDSLDRPIRIDCNCR